MPERLEIDAFGNIIDWKLFWYFANRRFIPEKYILKSHNLIYPTN